MLPLPIRIIIQIKNGTDTNSDQEVITIIIMIEGQSRYELLRFSTNFPENLAFFQRRAIEDRQTTSGGGTRKNQCGGPCPKWGGVAKIDFQGGLTLGVKLL